MKRHASKNKTAPETQRIFDRYVLPQWRKKLITDIGRRDVADLLDKIEDGRIDGPNGKKIGTASTATAVLRQIGKLMNWYAERDDSYVSPIVKGMRRTKAKSRDRILSDNEIRVLWPLLDSMGTYGAIAKVLFLTSQRRDDVARMVRAEIDGDIWTIPAERHKSGKPHMVPLSDAARAVIENQPVFQGCDFVFSVTGQNAFSGFSKAKKNLDQKMLEAMREQDEKAELPEWVLHDLRRTGKTLMVRAGVLPHISERAQSRVIAGVEGVYDRHSYLDEKRDALDRLATMIDRIVNPLASAETVVELRPGRAAE